MHTGFRCDVLWERDHLVDIEVDERIILKWNFKKYDCAGGVNSVDLAQDKDT